MSSKQRRQIGRILIGGASAIVLVMLGGLGWQWASGLMVEEIQIQGYRHAALTELRSLVPVDSSTAMLDVEPDSVAAEVEHHPWVKRAAVTRWPTGRLQIKVEERMPVAIALNRSGSPAHYFDADGFAMPLVDGAHYDVPPVSGSLPEVKAGQAVDGPLGRFLLALERVPREASALIGDVEIRDGEIWVRTLPTKSGETIPVRLGRDDFDARLIRMHTFWHRAVMAQPDKQFAMVDLRFNSQVVTRESERKR